MTEMKIEVNTELLAQLQKMLNAREDIPETKKAMKSIAVNIKNQWQGWATGGKIDGIDNIKNPNSNLAKSIKLQTNNPLDYTIYTDSPYAERIHNGMNEFDMKKKYPYGNKSRVSKDGVAYLIIPFRWGTPKAGAHFYSVMPQKLYDIMKKKKMSKVTGNTHYEANANGIDILRQEYKFNGRLGEDEFDTDDEQMQNYSAGMVRMKDSATMKSTYFTFRVISAKSPANSWIRKAVDAIDVPAALEKNNIADAEKILENAVKADLGIE